MDIFPTERRVYDTVIANMRAVFKLDAGFPENVFNRSFGNFVAIEFEQLFMPDFWVFLDNIAKAHASESIDMTVVAPGADAHFFFQFGYYGCMHVPTTMKKSAYKEMLLAAPAAAPVDSVEHVARVLAYCGNTRDWGIWADRDIAIAIVATKRAAITWPMMSSVGVHSIPTALECFAKPAFARWHEYAQFEKQMMAAYGSQS